MQFRFSEKQIEKNVDTSEKCGFFKNENEHVAAVGSFQCEQFTYSTQILCKFQELAST